MPRPAQKQSGLRETRRGCGCVMSIQELVVRPDDDVWELRRGQRLLSTQPTQTEALGAARVVAEESAARGVRTKILVGGLDGNLTEVTLPRELASAEEGEAAFMPLQEYAICCVDGRWQVRLG